jgi:4-hydroxy-3-methylbut-2-enyl diphosphate reductase
VEVAKKRAQAREIVMIGHHGHPEVEGTMGQANGGMYLVEGPDDVERLEVQDPSNLAFVTQTTLSIDDARRAIDALKKRFPNIVGPKRDDICYATQNRQDAVKKLLEKCDVVVVVGSRTSSNSNRLRELADRAGVSGYLVDGPDDMHREWFDGKRAVGVTAGASAPELLVQQVVERLRSWGAEVPEEVVGREEKVFFALPRELRVAAKA